MARSETERLAEKTVERQFLHELEVDFELAPATSRALLSAAQQVLLSCCNKDEVRIKQLSFCNFRQPSFRLLAEIDFSGFPIFTDLRQHCADQA